MSFADSSVAGLVEVCSVLRKPRDKVNEVLSATLSITYSSDHGRRIDAKRHQGHQTAVMQLDADCHTSFTSGCSV